MRNIDNPGKVLDLASCVVTTAVLLIAVFVVSAVVEQVDDLVAVAVVAGVAGGAAAGVELVAVGDCGAVVVGVSDGVTVGVDVDGFAFAFAEFAFTVDEFAFAFAAAGIAGDSLFRLTADEKRAGDDANAMQHATFPGAPATVALGLTG